MIPAFLANLDPDIFWTDNYVTVDFETDTSHGDYGHPIHKDNGILLACWKLGPGHPGRKMGTFENGLLWDYEPVQAHWGNELQQERLIHDLQQAELIVAHNAKYELGWLHRMGLDLYGVMVFCTKIGEYVLLGNRASGDDSMRPLSTSLDMCAKRRGLPPKDPVVDMMIRRGVNPKYIPRPWLQGRCERDVWETELIFHDQRHHLAATGRLAVQYTRCLGTPFLAHTEFEGMALDREAVVEEHLDHTRQKHELELEVDQMTGGINWRSGPQVAEFLYNPVKGGKEALFKKGTDEPLLDEDGNVMYRELTPGLGFKELTKRGKPVRTAKGKRKTDKQTLEKLKPTTAKQRRFLELRRQLGTLSSALSKNLDFFLGVCKEYGGVFHAVFNQTTTATHRLSSSGIQAWIELFEKFCKVQFQNLPRKFKRLFMARRKGWLFCETDGSQLEFRVCIDLSRDVQGQKDILAGHDVHRFTASVLNGIPESEVTKDLRQDAKPDTFKPVYGGKTGTPAQERYYAAFRERYPDLASTQKSWVYEVLNTKRLITPWGMRYYWPYAKANKNGYVNVESAVYNYPVQAFATAEIIPIAFTHFWHRVRAEGLSDYIKCVNTVHDSILCEVHPDYVNDYRRLSIIAFTHDVYRYLEAVYNYRFDWVPLGVGITVGDRWSKGNEESYNVFHDGRCMEVLEREDKSTYMEEREEFARVA